MDCLTISLRLQDPLKSVLELNKALAAKIDALEKAVALAIKDPKNNIEQGGSEELETPTHGSRRKAW